MKIEKIKEIKDNHWNNINKTRGFTSFGKSKPNELTAEYKQNKIKDISNKDSTIPQREK